MMNLKDKTVELINTLLFLSTTFLFYGLLYAYVFYEIEKVEIGKVRETEYIVREMPEEPEHEPIEIEAVNEVYDLVNIYQSVPIKIRMLELKYMGKYFVTAYASAELGGSTATSSGATCHYSDDPLIPTTCAIDLKYGRRYGEIYMIEGKLYVAEDTGAFTGAWIDCYVPDMQSVYSWNTGYKSVYSVKYVYREIERNRYEQRRMWKQEL